MANGKKPKKGIQIDSDIKKAYNKVVNTAAETIAGPVYQGVKALYSHLNPSQAKEASVKKPSPPKKEKIYDLGVLPEHEVVYNKPEHKGGNKPLEAKGAEHMSQKAPIIPVKNPLENRSDLKRNSIAMMKVKNPQKQH